MAAGAATIGRGAGRISRRLDRLSERKFALLVSIPGLLLLAAIVAPPILSVFGPGLFQDPVNWLQNTGQAVTIAIIAQAWRGVPLLAVLLLAALKTIPGTLYRAAKMDGATSWESFRFITLPAIRPTLIIVGILQVI